MVDYMGFGAGDVFHSDISPHTGRGTTGTNRPFGAGHRRPERGRESKSLYFVPILTISNKVMVATYGRLLKAFRSYLINAFNTQSI